MNACLSIVLAALWAQHVGFVPLEQPSSPSYVQEPKTAEDVLAKVRGAVHYYEWRSSGKALLLTGVSRREGIDAPFTLQFDPSGRWIERDPPPVASTTAFDRKRYWTADSTGATEAESMGGATASRYLYMFSTDLWLAGVPSVSATLSVAGDEYKLQLTIRDAAMPATICVSKHTYLPTRATVPGPFADIQVRFLAWTAVAGLLVPSVIEGNESGDLARATVSRAEVPAANSDETYKMPAWIPADTVFDASVATAVETKRTSDGHILVHPRLNGRNVGWFLLDSGSGSMVVDSKVAKDLGLKILAPARAAGATGKVAGWRCTAGVFSLGPIAVKDLPFIVSDMAVLSKALGVAIAGMVGYDIFRRAVVVIPGGRGDVSIPAPIRRPIDADACQFEGRAPLVYLECERGAGWFMLDTGYNGPVTFFARFVRQTRLLEAREVRSGEGMGLGGKVALKVGIIGWATFGGNRIKEPPAFFSSATAGAWAGRYTSGSIGQYTLGLFDMTFDYGGPGVTFKPAEGVTCIGDGAGAGGIPVLPGPEWVCVITQKTFYERHLNPGETGFIDVLEPDLLIGVVTDGCHERTQPLGQPKGHRVIFSRDRASN